MKLWIARCWGLRLYEYKPKLFVNGDYKCFLPTKGKVYEIDIDLFPEVTFENSPQEVELKLVNNESKWDILKSRVECLMGYSENVGNEDALVAYQQVYKHIEELELEEEQL